MLGIIERIKNNVLLRCNTLNDMVISDTLVSNVNIEIYHFAEELISLLNGLNFNITEEVIRKEVNELVGVPIIKKIKRKLFIDSLALQITNDTFIEDYALKKMKINDLQDNYLTELNKNKDTNQLNMTENLNIDEIINNLYRYADDNIIPLVKENSFLADSVNLLINKAKGELEKSLINIIKNLDNEYLKILEEELKKEIKEDIKEEGEKIMENVNDYSTVSSFENDDVEIQENEEKINKFNQYDDMTLFNKTLLSLNTREEKLIRKEKTQENGKNEIEQRLISANKNIEVNISRENALSQRQLELNNREVSLNARLSEAEVIFLNMKPLINGLNNIKTSEVEGGSNNE
ncbi:MAG: hypothetical protein RSA10_00925 [Bacilli bacterium]